MLNIAELTTKKYTRTEGRDARGKLSQGEVDVLEQVRQVLGWPTTTSLAVKYFPLYPNRKWWLEAMRRVNHWARRKNIVYFLKCLSSIAQEHLAAAFSGREALNRLVHHTNNKGNKCTNRLESTAKGNGHKPDLYSMLKYPQLLKEGGVPF